MRRSGLSPNPVSLLAVLPACDAASGAAVHAAALRLGCLHPAPSLGNALVDFYAKLGDAASALRLFRSLPRRNSVSWNSAIGGLVRLGRHRRALQMFAEMLSLADDHSRPNSTTLSILLPALAELGRFDLGRQVHCHSIRTHSDSDVYVANSLVDMYAKSGLLSKASDIFARIPSRNVVSWNAMIAGLAQGGAEADAFQFAIDMQRAGELPNSVTLTNLLPACARLASAEKGKEIHARSIRVGSASDSFVSNALIDMYAKCGQLNDARRVFDRSERDDVSYNTLIMGYSQSPQSSEALRLFLEMRSAGLEYDIVSFMGVLSSCANLSALKKGNEVHSQLIRRMLSSHLFVANSLLDLYTKCGRFDIAMKVFDRIPNKDVASWNSVILGYGMQGEIETVFKLFDLMKDEGVECDHVSYIAVLSACSHGGLVERGKMYFNQMLAQKMKPRQMHYSCMVDLLGRAGLLKEAAEIIREMPFEPDSDVWGALLGACRIHGNVELARWAGEHLFNLKPRHSGYYILLSNMYAEAGRWDEANEIRKLMKSRKVKKRNPGCSWVESGGRVAAFVVGELANSPEGELLQCGENG
ncbi:Pentatricopeptide repeat-containing protein [Ananas comosus]|uniref:Pentatricopeptide repeat-containing protein n=1 Tax=Ananas comosus TaxID=4615 RepID=A0A199VCH0_ANACO|nr:Pentatricopeptide repeat-containing protein [Ananas comosus]